MHQRPAPAILRRVRASNLGLATVLASALAFGSGSSRLEAQRACGQCLNGFRFMPSSIIGSPFASTWFTNATGAGMAIDPTVPVRNLEGQVVDSIGGDIGFLLLDFEYQQSVFRWLALRAGVTALARIGTSTEAIVASGASAAFGASLGATVPVWRGRQFLVSVVGDFRRGTQYVVDPYGFAQQVADSGYDEQAKRVLLQDQLESHWSAGVRVAWALQSWMGINALVESGGIDSPIGNDLLTQLGAQLAFDFNRIWSVPLGLSFGYRENAGSKRTSTLSGSYQVFEFGLFYTGRRAFAIGANLFWSRLAVSDGNVPDLDAAQIRLVTRLDF